MLDLDFNMGAQPQNNTNNIDFGAVNSNANDIFGNAPASSNNSPFDGKIDPVASTSPAETAKPAGF